MIDDTLGPFKRMSAGYGILSFSGSVPLDYEVTREQSTDWIAGIKLIFVIYDSHNAKNPHFSSWLVVASYILR